MNLIPDLLGDSEALAAARVELGKLLARNVPGGRLPSVLITGETGTGKSHLARSLHRASARAGRPFVPVNCAAIPESLLEAELFGFERGAFSGATHAKAGLFHAADGGVLFLDEVAFLPTLLQAKLLAALEDRRVRRLGSTRDEPVDVWVLAATSVQLPQAIRDQRFLEALYHRLAVFSVELPPLRERAGDALLLAEHFLARACADYGLGPLELGPEARAALAAQPWPGNVRELANVVERGALLADGPIIGAATLALPLPARAPVSAPALGRLPPDVERRQILAALEAAGGNLSRAAAAVGLPRNTLRYRIQKHGLARAESPARPPDDLRWERVPVSLLRVEIEEGAEAAAAEKLEAFGGRIEARAAGEITASFGLFPCEDAPRLAALAARALRREAARAGVRMPRAALDHLDLHAGRGDAVSALDPTDLRAALARLERLAAGAPAGGIVAGSGAAPLLRRRFGLIPLGAEAFQLDDERDGLAPGPRMARFVGRDRELQLLVAHLEAARASRGAVVGVVGDPGIGKSRLLHELEQAAAGTVTVLRGRCGMHGGTIPYLPIIDLVAAAPGPLDPALRRLTGVAAEPDPLAGLPPETVKQRTSEAFRALVLGAAAQRPVIVAIEDLHWIDHASEELLGSLVDELVAAPVLLVCTYRPGTRLPWSDRSFATQIALAPVARDAARSIVRDVVEVELGGAALDEVLAKAEGNPFFLEEVARAVAEGRRAVPETVRGVLQARIERLGRGARRLIQTAAVLGRELPLAILAAVHGEPLAGDLVELRQRELLHGAGEGRCAFRHALTQEVAYEMVPDERRQALHLAAGRAIEAAHAGRLDEVCELLAWHHGRGGDREKALEHLERANRKAARANAVEEAKAFFDQASALFDRLPDTPAHRRRRLELLLDQETVMLLLLRPREYLELLERQRPGVRGLGDDGLVGRFDARLGFCHWSLGGFDEAIATLGSAEERCARAGLFADAGFACMTRQWAHWFLGDFAAVLRLVDECRRRMGDALVPRWAAYSLCAAVQVHVATGRWCEALGAGEAALALGAEHADDGVVSFVSYVISRALTMKGDVAAAAGWAERAVARAPTPGEQAWARCALAFAWCRGDRPREGIAILEDLLPRLGDFVASRDLELALVEGYQRLGEHGRALDAARRFIDMADRLRMPFLAGRARRLAADSALAAGAAAEAASLYARAAESLERLGAEPELALCRAALARLAT